MDVSDLFEKSVSPAPLQAEVLARWFAGSKIVDDEGRPLRLYHGTSKDKDFAYFNVPKRGAWFTSDPVEASSYSVENDSMKTDYDWQSRIFVKRNSASRVIPVFVRATNPAVFDSYPQMVSHAQNYAKVQGEWMTGLRAAGHDAVLVQLRDGIKHVIVLGGPHQIKSAIGNKTYNPAKRGMNEGG